MPARALVLVMAAGVALAVMGVAPGVAGAGAGSSPALRTVVIPDLGPGYTVSSQGPLNLSAFASDSPDPSAAAGALSTLGNSIRTYERMWQAKGGLNRVQNVVVRFSSPTGAQVFVRAAQRSLESGAIVSKGPLAPIPGAQLVAYFGATNESGVGEAITMRSGVYVALLSFFSAAAGNTHPITPAAAEKVAQAQYRALVSADGGSHTDPAKDTRNSVASATPAAAKKSASWSDIGWAVLAVVIVTSAVVTPLLLRRRRLRAEALNEGTEAAETDETAEAAEAATTVSS